MSKLNNNQKAALAAHLSRKFTQKIIQELDVNLQDGDIIRIIREINVTVNGDNVVTLYDTDTGEVIWPK